MLPFDAFSCLEDMRQNLPGPSGFLEKWFGGVAKEDLIPELRWSRDPLDGFWTVQKQLLRDGELIWSALIQANGALLSPGNRTLPGEVVMSFDPHFDSRPEELLRVADRIYGLKGTSPHDPKLRRVADRITDEMHRSLGERIPKQLTEGREVFRYTVLFYPDHLPQRFINDRLIPLLALPDCDHAMVLPHWYWSEEFLELWKPTPAQKRQFAERNSRKERGPIVHLSRGALEMLWEVMDTQGMDPEENFVRLRIDEGGVSLSFDQRKQRDDHQMVVDGLTILIDPETARHHRGTHIDFVDRGHERGFTVTND